MQKRTGGAVKVYAVYDEDHLCVREMMESDVDRILFELNSEGKNRRYENIRRYFDRQQAGEIRVFIAEWNETVVGFTTLLPEAERGPFAGNGVLHVNDFNVFVRYQRRGLGSRILDAVEKWAFDQGKDVCLGVGLHKWYGTAQRMYAKRGYIPDGTGVWFEDRQAEVGGPCLNNDELILYLYKKRPV